MFCGKCGGKLDDGVLVCPNCGNIIREDKKQSSVREEIKEKSYDSMKETFKANPNLNHSNEYYQRKSNIGRKLVDDENVIAKLGNGMIDNIITSEGFKNEEAILTDKRLYYSGCKGLINTTETDEIVELSDITGVKVVNKNPRWFIVIAVLVFITNFIIKGFLEKALIGVELNEPVLARLMGVLFWVILYFVRLKNFLLIQYAGGNIKFSLRGYSYEEIKRFQKSIFSAKDKLDN